MVGRIAIHVQHLLGAGHLVRAMSLAEALSDRGHRVLLLAGGFPIERAVGRYEYFQLPPARAIEGDFSRLVDEHDQALSDSWRRRRAECLLDRLAAFAPQVVVTETFPFGRRQFRFELDPLLAWVRAHPGVRLVASIRDVLQRRSRDRDRETVGIVQRNYDAVLVHGDPQLFRLDASFPLSAEITDRLVYTGYIHQPADTAGSLNADVEQNEGRDEILVSGGSGSVSARLLEVAQQARPLSSASGLTWRLLTGRGAFHPANRSEPGLILEPNRPDFYALLGRCALSISQAGYNTTLDILASGARAVMVPFAGNGETEQTDRARALERAGRVLQLAEGELTAESLASRVDRALAMTPAGLAVDLGGAANSAEALQAMLQP